MVNGESGCWRGIGRFNVYAGREVILSGTGIQWSVLFILAMWLIALVWVGTAKKPAQKKTKPPLTFNPQNALRRGWSSFSGSDCFDAGKSDEQQLPRSEISSQKF